MSRFVLVLFLIGTLGATGHEAWKVFGPEKKPPFWNRLPVKSLMAQPMLSGKGVPKNDLERLMAVHQPVVSGLRTWTSVDGRQLEAVATAIDEASIQLRVLPQHQVYSLPLQRLSPADRAFATEWRTLIPNLSSLPPSSPTSWPTQYDASRNVELIAVSQETGNYRWQTPGYEFRCSTTVDLKLLNDLARICQSIQGVTRLAPLPLSWGRPETERRVIVIHPTLKDYNDSDLMPNTAGCFEFVTGHVHVCLPLLFESDLMGQLRGMELKKRQTFYVLVHELIHQATTGIVFSECPAWVAEGLAEYFAALQFAPGRFRFRDTHVPVREYLVNRLGVDGVVDLKTYRVWHLESFLQRPIPEWNVYNVTQSENGSALIQYLQALLLVDYFSQADSPGGQHFRAYLEAVLTGAPPEEAASRHLLRGRSYAELEQSLTTYWSQRGCNLAFESNPVIDVKDARLGVGLESRLRR